MPVFLPDDEPETGQEPDLSLAIAEGFEVSRAHQARVGTQPVVWSERCLVVRSFSYQKTEQANLRQRLAKAEGALRDLTPAPGRGKRPITDEASLQKAIAAIESSIAWPVCCWSAALARSQNAPSVAIVVSRRG
ncbi:MAG: hypothetical protein IPF56_06455 [Chloroflexi bacterium]|nr:hypothetical protein [Chloroflexota bacterium]